MFNSNYETLFSTPTLRSKRKPRRRPLSAFLPTQLPSIAPLAPGASGAASFLAPFAIDSPSSSIIETFDEHSSPTRLSVPTCSSAFKNDTSPFLIESQKKNGDNGSCFPNSGSSGNWTSNAGSSSSWAMNSESTSKWPDITPCLNLSHDDVYTTPDTVTKPDENHSMFDISLNLTSSKCWKPPNMQPNCADNGSLSKPRQGRQKQHKARNKRHSMHEMLQVARECSGRDPSDGQLSFGEFCLFSRDLKSCYQNQTPRSPTLSKLSSESTSPARSRRSERNMSKSTPQYQVFLGGSCNPTTWRQDVAIPMLSKHGISYYNPQVSHWEEALLETEYQAKKTASVLFFVFDSATRNVAAMVEAAYIAGCHRKLVVVIDSYSGPGQMINGEAISEAEYNELSAGLSMVQDLVERKGIPVFSQVNHALNCTAKILRENIWPQDLGVTDKVQPVKYPHLQPGDKLVKLHDAFVNINSNKITLAEANVVFKVVTNRELTNKELLTIVATKKGVNIQELKSTDLPLKEKGIYLTFQEFCCIVAEFENQTIESRRLWDLLTQSVISPIQKIVDWALPRSQRGPNDQSARDVYLGGCQGARVSWRENVAIPLLRKHGLSFYLPATSSVAGGGGRLPPMEAAHIDNSRVLLFVISNNTRSVSQMALAAHYIGLGCNVVMCVQMLTQGAAVNGEELSPAAIKDYNRGRSYLTDTANKERIPVFSNIDEAMECVVQKCRTR